ncbi:hypothetical protein [Helicobacter rodentium]|uniref:hypothetical protein n=1 Tax=Helicobacter rodentium TaxID=59617 RepID=UPI0004793242|nr:hypothetical protein [Helicobacter rodentium]
MLGGNALWILGIMMCVGQSISGFRGETCHKARGKDYPPDCNMCMLRSLNAITYQGVFWNLSLQFHP